jgi:hypothetical protein
MTIKDHLGTYLYGFGMSAILAGAYCRAEDLPPPAAAATKEVVLVLDNSGSMKARDRQLWVRQVAEDFIAHGDPLTKAAVVLFDDDGRIELPLRQTTGATDPGVQAALEKINYKGQWTNISAALRRALEALGAAGPGHTAKTIVLLTDGKLETGDRRRDITENTYLREQFLAEATNKDIRVYAIGLGSTADTDLLQQIARSTHGDYYWAADGEGLKPVFQHIRHALEQDVRTIPAPEPTPTVGPETKVIEVPVVAATPQIVAPQITTAPAVAAEAQPVANVPTVVVIEKKPAEAKPKIKAKPPRAKHVAPTRDPEPVAAPQESDETTGWDGLLPLALVGLAGLLGGYLMKSWNRDKAPGGVDPSRSPLTSTSARACLYDLTGVTGRERHELSSTITLIGRIPPNPGERYGHVTINSPTIGRRHAVIEYKHYGFWLLDQNSKNGSFVNDVRATKEVCLSHGDRVRFHEYEFEFSLLGMGLADETTGTGELVLERRIRKGS